MLGLFVFVTERMECFIEKSKLQSDWLFLCIGWADKIFERSMTKYWLIPKRFLLASSMYWLNLKW
jgi:hypothetical protein